MKLVQCHIENFGKLNNFDYCFVDGFNNFKAANGWGKSTFATFIKAMFYGLPITTKKNLDENERKKYSPWQGGNYGGNLVFVLGEKQYKIERFFDKKGDVFNLYDLSTGKKSQDFTEKIGEDIFGLDADAFERSAYIPQKDLNDSLNESMTQKLNHMLQGATERFNYENAYASLDAKRSLLSNRQKTGHVQMLESQIEDIIIKTQEIKTHGQAITEIQKQVDIQNFVIENLLQKQKQIKIQINDYGKLQQKQANQELYLELSRKVSATQNEIKDCENVFNGHESSVVEVDNWLTVDKNVTEKEQMIKAQNDYLQERQQVLKNYFHGKVPSTEVAQAVYSDVLQYQALQAKAKPIKASLTMPKLNLVLRLGLFVGALCAVLGGVLFLTLQQNVVAITLFVLGGVTLLVGVYLHLINLINIKTGTQQNINVAQRQKYQTEVADLQKRVFTFLHQFENTNHDLNAINRVMLNLQEYYKIQEQIAQNQNKTVELLQSVHAESNKLEKYLEQFKFHETGLSRAEKLIVLKQNLLNMVNLKTRLAAEKQELEQFKTEKHFEVDKVDTSMFDINELQQKEHLLQQQIDTARESKSQLIAKINQIQNQLLELSELEFQQETMQNELNMAQQELSAVKNAMKYLQVANDSLATKFLTPMKNGLRHYLSLITNQKFDNLSLDTDFNVAFEEYGQLRSVDFYSKGYQNTIDLCLRFALIDVLYGQEKPFIILDDPLINLDEIKIDKAKQFLHELAKNYQLIYFSCHDSRC